VERRRTGAGTRARSGRGAPVAALHGLADIFVETDPRLDRLPGAVPHLAQPLRRRELVTAREPRGQELPDRDRRGRSGDRALAARRAGSLAGSRECDGPAPWVGAARGRPGDNERTKVRASPGDPQNGRLQERETPAHRAVFVNTMSARGLGCACTVPAPTFLTLGGPSCAKHLAALNLPVCSPRLTERSRPRIALGERENQRSGKNAVRQFRQP